MRAFEVSLKQQSKVAFNPKREKQRYFDFQNACKGMLCMVAFECLNVKVDRGKYLRLCLAVCFLTKIYHSIQTAILPSYGLQYQAYNSLSVNSSICKAKRKLECSFSFTYKTIQFVLEYRFEDCFLKKYLYKGN